MKRFVLDRRTVLRGMAHGALTAVALPTLDAMLNDHGTAYAQGTPLPKRFGLWFWGNGMLPERWVPAATGAAWELSEELAPLVNIKDYVSIVSGTNVGFSGIAHYPGTAGTMSGSPLSYLPPSYDPTFSAPSIDQVVAQQIGNSTRFKSLELGVSQYCQRDEGTVMQFLSHNGPNNANVPEYSPRAVFNRLFGNGVTTMDGQVDPRLMLRRSVLDSVRAATGALRARVGMSDRARLDQHLESIRALENQIMLIEEAPPPTAACMMPGEPGDPDSAQSTEQVTLINDAMSDLLALSLACDQSRVFSMQYSAAGAGTVYHELGITKEHHNVTHSYDTESVNKIVTFIMGKFAVLLERLKATPEGDGNLLDRCVILGSSEVSEPAAHSLKDMPIIVAGKGNGALKHPGIHHRSDGENTSNVLLAVLQAMDFELSEFGEGPGHTTTAMSEILA